MKNLSLPLPLPPPSLTSLPDDIVVNCLARIPRSYYLRLSTVCKSFRSLLSSTELYAVRSRLGSTEHCLYVCLWDYKSGQPAQWFTLWINPDQTKTKNKKKALLVSIPFSNVPCVDISTIVVGTDIYVIGDDQAHQPSSAVRVLDCRSHTCCDAPSMNVARKYPKSCVYDGKIYVIGGVDDEDKESSFCEVFDTKTQSWECLPDPCSTVRNLPSYRIEEFDGKICLGNEKTIYPYDTKQGKWECGYAASMRKFECVVVENVPYWYKNHLNVGYRFSWYDKNDKKWKVVNGLDSLREKYKGHSSLFRMVSFGGKLLVFWEMYTKPPSFFSWASMKRYHKKKMIWCTEISLEKRDGGEVWGNIEWVDIVHTAPASCDFLHSLAVSV